MEKSGNLPEWLGQAGWKLAIGILCVLCAFVVNPPWASANAVSVANARMINQADGQVTVEFKLAQDNPYGDVTFDSISFSDYIWVFVKYSTSGGLDYQHATLAAGGSVAPVADNKGAFIKASLAGPAGATFTVKWNYTADAVAAIDAQTLIKVCAMEMVEIPTGAFYYGPATTEIATFNNYNAGLEILVNNVGQIPTGAGAGWPNGYSAFYLAKYEVSQAQYVDFLNTITTTDAAARYDATLFNTYGYRIQFNSDAPFGARYTTDAPNRCCNFLNWDNDLKGYLAWAALRPMTEMEFEKAARGTEKAGTNKRTYPWGNTAPSVSTGSVDGGTHILHYANYNNIAGGAKPILVGWYLSQWYAPSATEATGASPYGITDLSGNVWEHLINCASLTVPANGDGTITAPASWPGAAAGKGLRGGGWDNTATVLQVSARPSAGWANTVRNINVGFRPARTK
ncbi:MAG: formylglycine-generating enzyme family protein [Planctomycetes bacterium]|nr:formylglycine-generating enzyme family protein [Planctomycetota bacterium]